MNFFTRTVSACAVLGIALAASTAQAQVTLVSQSRSVNAAAGAGGCSAFQSATAFEHFAASVTSQNGSGQCANHASASHDSTLNGATGVLSFTGGASTSTGGGGSSSDFNVTFDVIAASTYQLSFTGGGVIQMALTGPSTNISATSVFIDSGVLQPGRYTLNGRAIGFPFGSNASLTLTVTTLPFSISWSTIDGGGGTVANGPWSLSGTIGQFDATSPITEEPFYLQSGYWAILNPPPPPPPCDPDYNPDGVLDQDDVGYLIEAIAGGSNPFGRDLDFNRDGLLDQGDVADLINVIAGGQCP